MNPQHATIVTGGGAAPTDSQGYPWNARYTIASGNLLADMFQHAANYTGRAAKALNPVYDAKKVARTMVRCARRPKREVVVGSAGRMLALQHTLSLGLYERTAARVVDRDHFQDRPAVPSAGSLFEPMQEGTGVSGGWKADGGTPMRRAALIGAAVTVPALLVWRRLRKT